MSESNNKIPLCWKCRWIMIFFCLAVLGMWAILCFLEKPGQQDALSHWITVLIFLVTIVCTALPLYMNNRYLDMQKQIDDQQIKLKEKIEEQEKLKQDIDDQRKLMSNTYQSNMQAFIYLLVQLTHLYISHKKTLNSENDIELINRSIYEATCFMLFISVRNHIYLPSEQTLGFMHEAIANDHFLAILKENTSFRFSADEISSLEKMIFGISKYLAQTVE